MIKRLTIKNVQSHAETVLEFASGINCIIGSSNAGKTAILRALYWVRYNRPLGIDTLASHWVLNDKGALTEAVEATIENENGQVVRRRTRNLNQYIVNGKELSVVKSDVPSEVESVLSLSDTNIQRQLDEPFLLSKTSGEVARYFNKVVRLDVIDRVLSNAESRRRQTNATIEALDAQVAECQRKLSAYAFLEEVQVLFEKYDRVCAFREKLNEEYMRLKGQFEMYSEALNVFRKYDFSSSATLVEDIGKEQELRNGLQAKFDTLSNQELDFEYYTVKASLSFDREKKMAYELIDYEPDTSKADSLEYAINLFNDYSEKTSKLELELRELRKELPDICPLCGGVMDKAKRLQENIR